MDKHIIIGQIGVFTIGLFLLLSAIETSDITGKFGASGANVAHFGAIGDGVTDDTAAFEAAIKKSKGVLFIPKGTYNISSLSQTEFRLIGEGITQSILITSQYFSNVDGISFQ